MSFAAGATGDFVYTTSADSGPLTRAMVAVPREGVPAQSHPILGDAPDAAGQPPWLALIARSLPAHRHRLREDLEHVVGLTAADSYHRLASAGLLKGGS